MPTIERSKKKWLPKKEYRLHSIANKKLYNSKAWIDLRESYLNQHPFCKECERLGRLTPAKVVDHIIPINKGGDILPDHDGLQGLCIRHDAQKRARDK